MELQDQKLYYELASDRAFGVDVVKFTGEKTIELSTKKIPLALAADNK